MRPSLHGLIYGAHCYINKILIDPIVINTLEDKMEIGKKNWPIDEEFFKFFLKGWKLLLDI